MIQLDPVDMDMVSEVIGEKELGIKQRDRKMLQQLKTIQQLEKQVADMQREWAPTDPAQIERRIAELQDTLLKVQKSPPNGDLSPLKPVTQAASVVPAGDNGAVAPEPNGERERSD